ncbi:MAG: flagellar hook-length control protein FliK [Pseudomonadales bacterium]|nr:flagellar hook-length control protein FliK [Pseudomonadales bacterium]
MSIDLPSNLPASSSTNSQGKVTGDPVTHNTNSSNAAPSNTGSSTGASNTVPSNTGSSNVVTGVVIQTTQITPQSFDVLIEIDGKQLLVKSPTLLQPGEQLKLEFTAAGGLKLLEINVPKQETVVNNAIRTLISQQNSYQPLLSALLTLSTLATLSSNKQTNTSPISPESLHKGIPPDILKAVNKLIDNLPKPIDFQNSHSIKKTMSESGLHFEKKLADAVLSTKTSTAKPDNPSNTINNTETPVKQKTNPPTSVQQIIKRDFKANLLRLMTSLIQSQPTEATKLSSNPPRTLQQIATLISTSTNPHSDTKSSQIEGLQKALAVELAKNSTHISTLLDTVPKPPLMGTFFMQPQATAKIDTKPKSWMDNIVATLAKLTLSSLSRLQLHQLASLPQTQEGQTSQSWSLELPVLYQDEVHLFQIQIGEEETPSKEEEEKEKLWKVNLAFDIEPLGPMHIQLTMIGDIANATIWADNKILSTSPTLTLSS